LKKVDHTLIAPVDPTMEDYHKFTHNREDFQKLVGNIAYCWRYATAQSLGMPFLVFESMMKTIQAYIKAKGITKYKEISKVLSDADILRIAAGGDDHPKAIAELKDFVSDPKIMIYQDLVKNAKNKDGMKDNADMDKKLRHLITCVGDPKKIEEPTVEKIEKFLSENPKWRRVIFYGPGHVGILLLGDEKLKQNKGLYFADGNFGITHKYNPGAIDDGQMYPFQPQKKETHVWSNEFFEESTGSGSGSGSDSSSNNEKKYSAYEVNRDKCEQK